MITDIRLQQFRSYADASFEFSPHVNIILGPNASGKTNLLEAILVLARGSSYRVRDIELIAFEKAWSRLDAHLEAPETTRTIKIVTEPRPTKTYELDERVYQRLTLPHMIPVVLFEPNHLGLLHGSPQLRRTYLDDLLEQTVNGYGTFRRTYQRLLSQRNALLKRSRQPSTEELFPWNLRLSELGAVIARHRHDLVGDINARVGTIYHELSEANTKLTVDYLPSFPIESYESHMLQKLETHAQLDAERGFTSYGPHREDFSLLFDSRSADETASRGETRTAILALKVIELQLLELARNQTPLLLLDDVFSELDGTRRRLLTNFLQPYQTFLTTTDADVVVKHFTENSTIIPIDSRP